MEAPAPKRDLIVLIDQTVVASEALQGEVISKVLRFLSAGDRIRIVSFSAYAARHYTQVELDGTFDTPLAEADIRDLPVRQSRRYGKCVTQQRAQGRRLVAKRLADAFTTTDEGYDYTNTEIITMLYGLASDVLSHGNASERILLVFSDLLENSTVLSVFSKGHIRAINAQAELKKLKQQALIPDLANIRVYVVGAGWLGDGSLYQDATRMLPLRKFWAGYFELAGARLAGFGEPMLLIEIE